MPNYILQITFFNSPCPLNNPSLTARNSRQLNGAVITFRHCSQKHNLVTVRVVRSRLAKPSHRFAVVTTTTAATLHRVDADRPPLGTANKS